MRGNHNNENNSKCLDIDGISIVFNLDVFFNWLNQMDINEPEIVVLIIIIHTFTL